MLKIYLKLDDVPEALREHYFLSDGRYVPQLSDDHPVLVHNKALLKKNAESTAKVAEMEADLEEAKKSSVPRGHITIAKADAELLDKFKALGDVTEVTTKLGEHKTLSEQVAQQKRVDLYASVAKELGYNGDAFKLLPGLPDFEIRDGKDGKKTVVAKVQDGDKIVEKDAKEFIESSFEPFMPALQVKSTGVVAGGAGAGNGSPADPFAWAREFGKNWNESQPKSDVAASFGITK